MRIKELLGSFRRGAENKEKLGHFINHQPVRIPTHQRRDPSSVQLLADLDLVDNVGPIQLAIRLLIPAGSRLSVTHTTILRWVQRYLPEFESLEESAWPWDGRQLNAMELLEAA